MTGVPMKAHVFSLVSLTACILSAAPELSVQQRCLVREVERINPAALTRMADDWEATYGKSEDLTTLRKLIATLPEKKTKAIVALREQGDETAAQTLTIDRQESPDYWATSNAGVLFENISLGDVVLDSEISDITDNTSSWVVQLGGCKAAVERMIYLTNKKRARSGYLSWQNVGLVMGAKNNEPSDGVRFGVRAALAPTSYDDATGVLVYSIAAPVRSSLQLRADLFWSLFIADSVPAGAQLPAIRALHCTNTNSYEGWT